MGSDKKKSNLQNGDSSELGMDRTSPELIMRESSQATIQY